MLLSRCLDSSLRFFNPFLCCGELLLRLGCSPLRLDLVPWRCFGRRWRRLLLAHSNFSCACLSFWRASGGKAPSSSPRKTGLMAEGFAALASDCGWSAALFADLPGPLPLPLALERFAPFPPPSTSFCHGAVLAALAASARLTKATGAKTPHWQRTRASQRSSRPQARQLHVCCGGGRLP